jgi:hypothetical protein
MNESVSLIRVKRIGTGLAFILDQYWLFWVRSCWRLTVVFCMSPAILVGACASTQHEPASSSEHVTEFKLVEREAWGWQDNATSLPEHHIEKITIHHGGEKFPDDRDPLQYLRALQSWSRSDKGWIDIPYHFVIDLEGTVYEARPLQYPGDTNTSYDPTGHALIQIVGDYRDRELSAAQLTSVIQLSAMLARRHEVPVSDIRGHQDYAPGETVCPGENIYRYLRDGTITKGVAQLLSPDHRSE